MISCANLAHVSLILFLSCFVSITFVSCTVSIFCTPNGLQSYHLTHLVATFCKDSPPVFTLILVPTSMKYRLEYYWWYEHCTCIQQNPQLMQLALVHKISFRLYTLLWCQFVCIIREFHYYRVATVCIIREFCHHRVTTTCVYHKSWVSICCGWRYAYINVCSSWNYPFQPVDT